MLCESLEAPCLGLWLVCLNMTGGLQPLTSAANEGVHCCFSSGDE